MKPATRCAPCGEPVEIDDDAVIVHGGGLAHGECIAEHEDEPGLFGEQDPESAATGRGGAAFECSTAELERQRRNFRRRRTP